MGTLHRNLFYYYRGPAFSPTQVDTQLENNTTKALVNVLESCSSRTTAMLLNGLVGLQVARPDEKIHLALHEGTIGTERIRSAKTRVLLGISPFGVIQPSDSNPRKRDTPDAWIWGKNFVVLVENKTKGELLSGQLERYRRILGGCRRATISWINQAYPIVDALSRQRDLGDKDKLLITQFKSYLEMARLSGFVGFEMEDFARMHSEEREERDYVEGKLQLLAEQLAPRLSEWRLHHYPGGDSTWHGFVRTVGKYRCFELAHFAFFEDDYGLGVKLHVGGGPDLRRLRRSLREPPQKARFVRCLLGLRKSPRNYTITVYERVYSGIPFSTDEASGMTVESKYATKERLSGLVEFLSSAPKSWFSIYYTVEPAEAIRLGKGISGEVKRVFRDFRQAYRFVVDE